MGDREKSWAWPRVRQARCPRYTIKEGLTLGLMPKAGLHPRVRAPLNVVPRASGLPHMRYRLKVKTKTGRKERNTKRDKEKKGKTDTEKAAEPQRETHTLRCG